MQEVRAELDCLMHGVVKAAEYLCENDGTLDGNAIRLIWMKIHTRWMAEKIIHQQSNC